MAAEGWLLPALSQPQSQGLLSQEQGHRVCRAQSSLWGTGKCFCTRFFPSASAQGPTEVENTEFSRVLRAQHPPCSLHVFTLNLGAI